MELGVTLMVLSYLVMGAASGLASSSSTSSITLRAAGGSPERPVHGAEALAFDGGDLLEGRGLLRLLHGIHRIAAGAEDADHQPVAVQQAEGSEAQSRGVGVLSPIWWVGRVSPISSTTLLAKVPLCM